MLGSVDLFKREEFTLTSYAIWEQVRGGSSAPAVQKSSDEMIVFLKENPDAIGYVEEGKTTEDVKVLTVK